MANFAKLAYYEDDQGRLATVRRTGGALVDQIDRETYFDVGIQENDDVTLKLKQIKPVTEPETHCEQVIIGIKKAR